MRPRTINDMRSLIGSAIVVWLCLSNATPLLGQARKKRLIDMEPFDRITLAPADNMTPPVVLEVLPLDFPNRRIPADPKPRDVVKFRKVDKPATELETEWRYIAENGIEFYEDIVLKEIESMRNKAIAAFRAKSYATAKKMFDEVFEWYYFMERNYPNTDRLGQSVEIYLFGNGLNLAASGKHFEALAVFDELHRRNDQFSAGSLTTASQVNPIATKIVGDYVRNKDLPSAQALLRRLGNQYGFQNLPGVAQVRASMDAQAAKLRDEAQAHLDNERLREAHDASKKMMQVWPDVAGGRALAEEIAKRYPLVIAGVHQLAVSQDSTSLHNWAARRTGRLTQRTLLSFDGGGPTGGIYSSAFGDTAQYEDLRGLTLQLRQDVPVGGDRMLNGFDISRRLLRMADPQNAEYMPEFGGVMGSVRVEDIFRVQIRLRRPHVLPEAFLRIVLDPPGSNTGLKIGGPFVVDETTPESIRFVENKDYQLVSGRRPAELTERLFIDRERAVSALQRGEIDILDHIAPATAMELKEDESLVVEQYSLPTLHMLIPNFDNPYLENLTFRGALVSGIPRQAILDQVVLKDKPVENCVVISGPFPPGRGESDPLSYAYNSAIIPRPYDPRFAKTLMELGKHEISLLYNKRKEPVPKLETLILAHPPEQGPREVCQAIVEQLGVLELKVELLELPPGESIDSTGKADLTYVKIAMWEPITDARRLLGPEGLASDDSQLLDQALRRLEESQNWRDVNINLMDLHRLTHTIIPVIPLWQTFNYFGHHRGLRGVGLSPTMLYENIEQWQIAPRVP